MGNHVAIKGSYKHGGFQFSMKEFPVETLSWFGKFAGQLLRDGFMEVNVQS